MRAMILAAGRGKRMRPLTDRRPKPLLQVRGRALIDYHLDKLALQQVEQVVVNYAWLGEQIEQHIAAYQNDSKLTFSVVGSSEPEGGLETAGGIIKALPLLGEEAFWVVNGDIFTDFDFGELPCELDGATDMHLILVVNPPHNPKGDFALTKSGQLVTANAQQQQTYTYSGIGVFHPRLFAQYQAGSETFVPLRPLIEQAIQAGRATAAVTTAAWTDVGTPERLQQLQE